MKRSRIYDIAVILVLLTIWGVIIYAVSDATR